MNFKRLALIGVLALVVIGCVLAAGCTSTSTTPATTTSTTTTTSTDAVVGTWTLPNGTTVVFGEDFKGVMTTGDNTTNFTWKKTTDGKYQVDNEKGEQVIWTLDNVKGTMTNAAGMVLTKQVSQLSGAITNKKSPPSFGSLIFDLNPNGGKGGATVYLWYPDMYTTERHSVVGATNGDYKCLGYYTKMVGGTMVLDAEGECVISKDDFDNIYREIDRSGNDYVLYAHWDK